jgi:hypothetical protein
MAQKLVLRGEVGARALRVRCACGKYVDDHMDGNGEQPGPALGEGYGRSENLQGGVQRKATGGTRPSLPLL